MLEWILLVLRGVRRSISWSPKGGHGGSGGAQRGELENQVIGSGGFGCWLFGIFSKSLWAQLLKLYGILSKSLFILHTLGSSGNQLLCF